MSAPPSWKDPGYLSDRMKACFCPGLSIIEIQGFEPAWQAHLGLKAIGSGLPITAATLFQAASISKPVFALAVMNLVERGSVDLDAGITRYLRTWKMPPLSPPVTFRQLLNHSASASIDGFPGYQSDSALPSLNQILDGQAPANTPPIRIMGTPGLQYSYSGGGVTLAQKAFEDQLSQDFPAAMAELVLGPLGMDDSGFEQPLAPSRHQDAAQGHVSGRVLQGGWNAYPELAAAGLWTSARDLTKLGIAMMRRYAGLDSPLELSRASVAEMLRPKLEEQGPDKISVGIGWFCVGKDEELTFGHNGGNTGYVAQICLRPSDGSGLVFLANSSQAYPLLAEIMRHGREQVQHIVIGFFGHLFQAPGSKVVY